ncbi:MAG: hypothetical protein FJY75_04575 [Candidatus Eisenbacteria bacterium]|uniref:Tetratricopeptide repeat protein n=1 Tax=Eiseniibacteriota bacterium TaxID=2212470 RepID=A0A937X8G5_UNCEI|nr:hypothetical protein [Candidatus Eisenbacteria bacterium]
MGGKRRASPGPAWLATDKGLALALALLALLVRLLYLLESSGNPFRLHLGLDPANYDAWARTILGGAPFGPEPFFQAPLYPYFLSACYALLGGDPRGPLWIQALLGAAATYFGARIGGRAWGRPGLLFTGAALALYKPAVFYTGVLLVPTLATLLLALALWFAPRRPLLSGIWVGLATLAHPVLLPGGLLAAFALAALEPGPPAGTAGPTARGDAGGPGGSRMPAARALARLLVGTGLAILPATAHNLAVSGRFVPLAVNAGINLYIGNGPGANGFYRSPFGMRGEQDPLGIAEAARQAGRRLDPLEADAFWRSQAREALRADPARATLLFLRKAYFALHAYETPQIESLDFEKRYSLLLRLPILPNWIALLALGVGALLISRRRALTGLLLLSVLASAGAIAVFFVAGRFRMPLHLLLALAGSGGLAALWRDRAASLPPASLPPAGRRLAAAGVAAAALLLFAPNWLGVSRTLSFAQYHYRLGLIAEERGDQEGAMREYAAALALDATVARANINLGLLAARAGELDRAQGLLERGAALDPRSARAHLALGQIRQLRGDLPGAVRLYEQAWAADSAFTRALESLATTWYLLGDLERAQALSRELVDRAGAQSPLLQRVRFLGERIAERRDGGIPVWSGVAQAEGDLAQAGGDMELAEARYAQALESDPHDRPALLEAARLAARRGDAAAAAARAARFVEAGGPAAMVEPLLRP